MPAPIPADFAQQPRARTRRRPGLLLKAAMVDGRPDLGLMSSGQVAGLIDDLPSCAELIDRITAQAEGTHCQHRPGVAAFS